MKEQISADPQTRELAWQRHTQKLNENSELSSAKREGREEGEKKGLAKGREEGMRNMLRILFESGKITEADYQAQLAQLSDSERQ